MLAAAAFAVFAPGLVDPDALAVNFGDLQGYHYPLRFLAAGRLQAGALPFWNPYIFAGIPMFANPQTGTLYPGSLPFWIFPVGWSFTLFSAAHLLWGALGAYLWARAERIDRLGSFALALAFGFSPFLIGRVPQGVPTHLAGLSFVPWCWMALRARSAWMLGGLWGLQALGTHPQFPFLNALAMGLYALGSPKRRLPVMVKAAALAGGLAAIQLIPLLRFAGASSRSSLPEFFFNAYSQPLRALATLLCPAAWGDPLRGTFSGLPSEFYEEYLVYIGLVPLALGLLAVRSGRARFGWGLAAAGALLAAGRFNPLAGLVGQLPLLGYSRVPARFSLWIVWGLFLAAAEGWRTLKDARWKAALAIFVFLDMGFWAVRAVSFENGAAALKPNPVMRERLAGKATRFATGPEIANPNKAMLYRASNVNGYDAFFLERFVSFAYRAEGKAAADPSRSYLTRVDSPELKGLGVTQYLTASGGGPRFESHPDARPLARLETADGWTPLASVANPSPERWELSGVAPAGATLVLAVPKYPGWRARLDGVPVETRLHDGLTQEIPLAPGPFTAEFWFLPPGWALLAALAAVQWAGWLGIAFRDFVQKAASCSSAH